MLQDRIIAYVTASNGLVSLEKLVLVAKPAGFSEGEVLATLSKIGKKLKATARGGVVYYQVPPVPKPVTISGAEWVTKNYPWPGVGDIPPFVMPFPEIDMSHIFMTRDEAKEYKAQASGRPIYMMTKHYASQK